MGLSVFRQYLCQFLLLRLKLFAKRFLVQLGHRIFANMTFANYWRKSRRYIGECLEGILVEVRWRFANIGESQVDIRQ